MLVVVIACYSIKNGMVNEKSIEKGRDKLIAA
jgi:hypothetical protein